MSNFIADRICFYSSMFRGRSSAVEIINCAADFNVGGVELMSFCDELKTPDMQMARKLGAMARERGLALPCFSVAVNLAGDDRDARFEWLRGYAEICSELEIPYLHHTIIPGLNPAALASGLESEIKRGIEMALRMNECAATLGVKTIVEDQGFAFNGVGGFGALRSASGGRIGTLLDIGNIMFVDERAEDFGRAYADSIVHVHIKDYKILDTPPADPENRAYTSRGGKYILPAEIGTADVNLPAVAAILRDVDYKGYFAMEFERVKDMAEVERVLGRMSAIFS